MEENISNMKKMNKNGDSKHSTSGAAQTLISQELKPLKKQEYMYVLFVEPVTAARMFRLDPQTGHQPSLYCVGGQKPPKMSFLIV